MTTYLFLNHNALRDDKGLLNNAIASIKPILNEIKRGEYRENVNPYILKLTRFPEGDIVFLRLRIKWFGFILMRVNKQTALAYLKIWFKKATA